MNLKSYYGPTEGPLGFPMQDRQAQALAQIMAALPKDAAFSYRKAVAARGPTETGTRTDVSWITTEDPDRQDEVVLARGMNDGQYKLNPIVTMQHSYGMPPVGKSLWRKATRDGPLVGVKAKTQYPARPDSWDGAWPADVAFSLVQADLLRGKSIGFLPTKIHAPSAQELSENNWDKVNLVIDEWLLLEYACTFLPAQQNAVVEAVSKSAVTIPEEFIKAMGLDPRLFEDSARRPDGPPSAPSPPEPIPFTSLSEIEDIVAARLKVIADPRALDARVQAAVDRARGRI
jgi:hypothetical protein